MHSFRSIVALLRKSFFTTEVSRVRVGITHPYSTGEKNHLRNKAEYCLIYGKILASLQPKLTPGLWSKAKF